MYISHKYKLIFIHIPKNAGTFIYTVLSYLDDNISIPYSNHISAKETKNVIEDKIWNEYTKFCIIRNSFDYAVSLYSYIKSNKHHINYKEIGQLSFQEYIIKLNNMDNIGLNFNQIDFITSNSGEIIVDYLIDFNNLNYNLAKFFIDVIKISPEIVKNAIPQNIINESIRCRDYTVYYDQKSINLLYNIYRTDIDKFKFKFNDEKNELLWPNLINVNNMKSIFILGENSFLAKCLYIKIKKQKKYNVILLNHKNYYDIKVACDNDIVINFCGINRANFEDVYEEANHIFLQKIIENLHNRPFFIHISSLMVYGFKDKDIDSLSNYQKWFIKSKLNGEKYLLKNYPEKLLCIIRPSNIYGYNCTPYYNNLLSTLIYEKIMGFNKINNININCSRNLLSIDGFINKLYEYIENKNYGSYNFISNNNVTLDLLINYIYNSKLPDNIALNNGDIDLPNTSDCNILGVNICINENLQEQIKNVEEEMKIFLKLKENIEIKKLNTLVQPRGNMVEITNLTSKRLYKITLTKHSVRGNHYHHEQIEDFYTNLGKVLYLFAYSDNPNVIYQHISTENELISIKPNIVHTLANDFLHNNPELIISSTQEFVADNIPDTEYINII